MSLKKYAFLLCGFAFLAMSCDTKTKNVDSCGDGFLDPGEACDGSQMTATTCDELGYHDQQGVLTCKDDCSFDLSVCTGGRCGDGTLSRDHEDCEGDLLDGQTCLSLGYERGTLACGADCRFDRAGCEGAGSCGDGVIQEPEACEGTDLGGATCQSLGYYTGALVCREDCQFDLGRCEHKCGDAVVDEAYLEECDGAQIGGRTCEDFGYYGTGALTCAADCLSFDEAGCEAEGWCGDGAVQIEHGEVCDGTILNGQTCETRGWYGGTLVCSADCLTLDEASCETYGRCGDGTIQSGNEEQCDGANLDAQTCQTRGFFSGTLVCGDTCAFDTGSCSMNHESANIGTLIHVPAGTFQRDETATNLSVVSVFRMSKYEITRAQWTAVTGWADPSNGAYSSGTNDPVQMVSWYDAIAFCNKLSLLEGLTQVYTVSGVDFTTLPYAQIPTVNDATWNAVTVNQAANGYRLPTEMEWMWAAMGADNANPGSVNTTGYAKAFAGSTGNNLIGDYAVFGYGTSETGRTTTPRSNPVGSKLANELGFHDLSGNVLEWEWDWYLTYPSGTLMDYRGPAPSTNRVARGGYWSYNASDCAVATRGNFDPAIRLHGIGFRVVRP